MIEKRAECEVRNKLTGRNAKSGVLVNRILALFLAGCLSGAGIAAFAQDRGEPLPCDYKQLGLDAAKFYIYLTQDTPYRSWALWPGKEKLSPGKAPHGRYVTTYVNPAALRSLERGEGMSFGSLIVAENYDAGKQLTGLLVKLKIKGYDPPAGDWYWFQYDSRGAVIAEGRVDSCKTCHRTQAGKEHHRSEPER